jgi:excisionase family DNA binding protein
VSLNSTEHSCEAYSMIKNDELAPQRDAPVQKLLLTLPEAGRALAISRSKMYDLLNAGHLPSVHIGRSRRVRMSDVEHFVNSGGVRCSEKQEISPHVGSSYCPCTSVSQMYPPSSRPTLRVKSAVDRL